MKSILIIDDDELLVESLEIVLKNDNFNVTTAKNGNIALKKLEMFAPDIILLDIIMPDMEGIEFLRRRKSLGSNIPVIMMSGNPIGMDFFRVAKLLGAKDSIKKPFSKKELLDLISRYV